MLDSTRAHLLRLGDAAQLVGIPVKRLRAAARSGDLRVVRVGTWARVRRDDLNAWLRRHMHGGADPADELAAARDHVLAAAAALGSMTGPVLPQQRAVSRALDAIEDARGALVAEPAR